MECQTKLESDLSNSLLITNKLQDDKYTCKLYAALCNIQWYHLEMNGYYTYTWRIAASIVANLRRKNEDYLYFYCGGLFNLNPNEGTVDSEISDDLLKLGWTWREYSDGP
jgi:hypothetical protein